MGSALEIQAEIEETKELIDELKKEIAKKPLSLTPDQMSLLNDVTHANDSHILAQSINASQQEITRLENDLKAKQKAVDAIDEKKIQNSEDWKKAKDWTGFVLKSRQEIYQLSQDVKKLEKDLDGAEEPDLVLSLEGKIGKKNKQIKNLKEKIVENPLMITPKQTSLINEMMSANTRYLRALNYVDGLTEKRKTTLAKLNAKDPNSNSLGKPGIFLKSANCLFCARWRRPVMLLLISINRHWDRR